MGKFRRRRRTRTRRYRRRRSRKYRKRKRRGVLYRAPTPFPRQKVAKLRYSAIGTITPTTPGAVLYFRANGPFDPEASTTGHQPMGYDQWGAFYYENVTISAKISFKFVVDTGVAGSALFALRCVPASAASVLPRNQCLEQPGVSTYMCNSSSANDKATFHLSKTYSAKKFWGLSSIKDNDANLFSAFGSLPNEEADWELAAYTLGGTPATYTYTVSITYNLMFRSPKNIVQS